MPLTYYLTPNRISGDDADYLAITVNNETYTIDDIYELMTRQGSTLTKAEALAAFEEITGAIARIVGDGGAVVTPLANIRPTVGGVFNGPEDRFDPKRHEVRIQVSAGLRLRAVREEVPTRKIPERSRQPQLRHYMDKASETRDRTVTPVGGGRITGRMLKFDPDAPAQGIFFVNSDDGTATRVPTRPMRNVPSELIFINPELPPGTYRLQVRTLFPDNSTISAGSLDAELTVE